MIPSGRTVNRTDLWGVRLTDHAGYHPPRERYRMTESIRILAVGREKHF
jgi:hypothetical protein